jgi:hypothetical protein
MPGGRRHGPWATTATHILQEAGNTAFSVYIATVYILFHTAYQISGRVVKSCPNSCTSRGIAGGSYIEAPFSMMSTDITDAFAFSLGFQRL